MADLSVKHKSLSQRYVFYESLKSDNDGKYIDLYNNVSTAISSVTGTLNSGELSQKLLKQAENESIKETLLLQKIFQVNITPNLWDEQSIKYLIDTLNNCLNLKEVYQRNIARIKTFESQISIAQLFPSYFSTVWNANKEKIANSIQLKRGTTVIKEAEKILNKELPLLVEQAIQNMFNSSAFKGQEEQYHAYESLTAAIGRVNQPNSFANQIYNLYHLEEFKQEMLKQIKNSSKKTWRNKISQSNSKIIQRNQYSDGGISLEYLEGLIAGEIVKGLKASKNIQTGGVYHSGGLGIKADNIISFNIDPAVIEQSMETDQKINRERNRQMTEGLSQKISNIDNSFIIYSNAKNYSLSSNFKGFSVGDSMTLESYEQLLGTVQKNIKTFIGAVAQTIPGAIGENNKAELEDIAAADIAYLLFDDFKTIGELSSKGQSLHVFNLDGVYVPLSFFLWLLGNSMSTYEMNPHTVVKVSIKTPSQILYPSEKNTYYTQEMWNNQRTTALEEITISAKFLSGFQNIISKYL